MRYGTFFGVTAVHLMFMTESEIDRIFDITAPKADTLLMLHNLYTEVEALKAVFNDTPTSGVPHVILTKDNTAQEVTDLVAGFNVLLGQKSVTPTNDSDDFDFSSFDAGSDAKQTTIDETDLSALDSFSAETTSHFSSEDTDLSTLSDQASTDDSPFANIFNDSDEDELNLLTEKSANVPVKQYTDLIEMGRSSPLAEKKVRNILQLSRYLMTHKEEFSAEESESIMQQISDLPKIPSAVELPKQFIEMSKALSPQSLDILKSLYVHMMRKVKPKNSQSTVSLVDYVADKLKLLLVSKITTMKQLYFASQSLFSMDLTLIRWMNIISDLNNIYLCQKHVSTILGNVETLIADCNETLGRTSNKKEALQISEFKEVSANYLNIMMSNAQAVEIEAMSVDWSNKLIELLGRTTIPENYQEHVTLFFTTLLKSGKLLPLLGNVNNLRMLAYIDIAMYRVVTSEIGSKLNRSLFEGQDNSDLDTVVRICSPVYKEFTLETGVMGFQCNYTPKLLNTLNEVVTPLEKNTSIQFSPESVNYRLSSLLRKHLKSLQKRLYNYK